MSGWIKRSYKREWLQKSPMTNCVSYRHELRNNTVYSIPPDFTGNLDNDKDWQKNLVPREEIFATFEMYFSIGSKLIRLHNTCQFSPSDALSDYIRKIKVIKELINRFIRDYKQHYDKRKAFTLKEFLNGSEGHTAMFTSTCALSWTHTHDFFFEIASCDDKARLYIYDEKEFIEIMNKLQKILTSAINDAQATLDTYKGRMNPN